MVPFNLIIAPLSKALVLSLGVERGLEFMKNVLEPILVRPGAPSVPSPKGVEEKVKGFALLADLDTDARRVDGAKGKPADEAAIAEQRKTLADELKKATDPKRRAELLKRQAALSGEWDEHVPVETVLVEPATDPDDGWTLRALVLQLVGLAAGIALAHVADVRLFGALLQGFGAGLQPWQDYVLTGLFIGGGSGPAHILIRFITERKEVVQQTIDAAEGAEPARAPAPPSVIPLPAPAILARPGSLPSDWVDIPYEGGVDRDQLEHVHRRKGKPNLIVYHHTAMNSASPFEDIVRVIKARGFLTAYHCVVLADGSIRPFCRWDRFGSHAKNFNAQSLGISLHGSFEADPRVPDSNPDGRLGVLQPTEAQLDAAARIVALWTFLYGVRVDDFANTIIPHNKIAPKACPGSRFPHARFQERIETYCAAWKGAPAAMAQIEAFKRKPYVGA